MRQIKKYVASRIKLADRFFDLVLAGSKTSTIRYGLVFFSDNKIPLISNNKTVNIRILKLDYSKTFGELDENDAKRDGFTSLLELRDELQRIYPDINNDDPITIIYFKVE